MVILTSLIVFCALLTSEIRYQLGQCLRYSTLPLIGCIWSAGVLFMSPTGTGPDFFLESIKSAVLWFAILLLSAHQLLALNEAKRK